MNMREQMARAYHYARDHYSAAMWCVRGPNDFYLSVPEKNLAWAIGEFLSGRHAHAYKEVRNLLDMLERDGFPDYLKEPKWMDEERARASRIVVADASKLGMRDRLKKRLDAGWPASKDIVDVVLDEMVELSPSVMDAAMKPYDKDSALSPSHGIDCAGQLPARLLIETAWKTIITAIKEGK